MERRFNPLDPLGIFGLLKELPGPPGMARRTEEERVARHLKLLLGPNYRLVGPA